MLKLIKPGPLVIAHKLQLTHKRLSKLQLPSLQSLLLLKPITPPSSFTNREFILETVEKNLIMVF